MATLKDYFSLVKFSHTVFAMPFALLSFVIALKQGNGTFEWISLLYIILCMIFARNAAMGFNRYADKKIDALNERTAQREIPAGIISPKSALFFIIVNSLLFVGTSFLINRLCFFLSPVALILLLGYSLTKRFTFWCHFILGLCLSIAPIGAYIAVTGAISSTPLILAMIVLTWSAGFDIIYSLQDMGFDKENRLFSIPARFGGRNALIFSATIHVLTTILLFILVFKIPFHWFGYLGSVLFLGLLIYQHVIVKPNDFSKINVAFGITNGLASLLYASFGIIDLLLN